jgi:hypothetical protein
MSYESMPFPQPDCVDFQHSPVLAKMVPESANSNVRIPAVQATKRQGSFTLTQQYFIHYMKCRALPS